VRPRAGQGPPQLLPPDLARLAQGPEGRDDRIAPRPLLAEDAARERTLGVSPQLVDEAVALAAPGDGDGLLLVPSPGRID
jgi:hypothetical protein